MTAEQDLKHPGLQRRGGVYYSRASIPTDLRRLGTVPIKETLRKSLKTSDRRQAVTLHHEFQAECLRYFDDVRNGRRDPNDLPAGIRPKGIDLAALELSALQAIEAQVRDWEARGREALARITSPEELEDYTRNIDGGLMAEGDAIEEDGPTFQRALAEFLSASQLTPTQVPLGQREAVDKLARSVAHLKLDTRAECLTDPDSRSTPIGRFRDTLADRIRSTSRAAVERPPTPSVTLLEALQCWKAHPKKAKSETLSAS